jgi:hypothetical protein
MEVQVLLISSSTFPGMWVLPSGGQLLPKPEDGYIDFDHQETPEMVSFLCVCICVCICFVCLPEHECVYAHCMWVLPSGGQLMHLSTCIHSSIIYIYIYIYIRMHVTIVTFSMPRAHAGRYHACSLRGGDQRQTWRMLRSS